MKQSHSRAAGMTIEPWPLTGCGREPKRATTQRSANFARSIAKLTNDCKNPRKRRRSRGLEKRVQGHIVHALRSLGYMVSTFSQAQRAQMTPGIPDLFACHQTLPAMWVEVKTPDRRRQKRGGLTLVQVGWHLAAKQCGQTVLVAYGVEDVLDYLRAGGWIQ